LPQGHERLGELLGSRDGSREALRRRLLEVERKISRLLDRIEEGDGDPDLMNRLRQRRRERDGIKAELALLDPGRQGDPTERMERAIRSRIGRTLDLLSDATTEVFREELRRHIRELELHEDGRLRLVGTYEGLLSGAATGLYDDGSGGPLRASPKLTIEFGPEDLAGRSHEEELPQ